MEASIQSLSQLTRLMCCGNVSFSLDIESLHHLPQVKRKYLSKVLGLGIYRIITPSQSYPDNCQGNSSHEELGTGSNASGNHPAKQGSLAVSGGTPRVLWSSVGLMWVIGELFGTVLRWCGGRALVMTQEHAKNKNNNAAKSPPKWICGEEHHMSVQAPDGWLSEFFSMSSCAQDYIETLSGDPLRVRTPKRLSKTHEEPSMKTL